MTTPEPENTTPAPEAPAADPTGFEWVEPDEDFEKASDLDITRDRLSMLVSSGGRPVIRIVFQPDPDDPSKQQAEVTAVGIDTAEVPGVLRELASLL